MSLKKKYEAVKLDAFFDARCKLLPCQKEMAKWWVEERGMSFSEVGKMFKVSRFTIRYIVHPELKSNTERVYDSKKAVQAVSKSRRRKKKIIKKFDRS